MRGAFGLFAHAHRLRQGFEKTNRHITKINAMRKAWKGQARRGFGAEKRELGGTSQRKTDGPDESARAVRNEVPARTTFGRR